MFYIITYYMQAMQEATIRFSGPAYQFVDDPGLLCLNAHVAIVGTYTL